MGSAELQLAARVEGIVQADVPAALWERRTLAKAWTLRGTLHIHPADELSLDVGPPRRSRRAGRGARGGDRGGAPRPPPQRVWEPEQALREAARRYAATYGPAGTRQLREWFGGRFDAAGLWRRRKTAKCVELAVEPARTLTRAERAALGDEAERIGAFLGLEPALVVA